MDRKQTNKLTMVKTVAGVLDQNNSVWSGMAPFAAAVDQFKNKIAAIDAAAQKQETSLHGAAGDKANARDALEDVLFLTCEALGVLALTTSDNELTALADVTPSGLDKLDDEELSNRATTVLARANAKKTELAALQVTQANIDELDQALQNFQAAKAKPRTAVVERSVQTESLSSLLREAGNILRDQIDRLVNLFRRSNPEFVAAYRSARVTVDRGGRHAAPPTPANPPTT
ncbi:MAG: hypothetical protein H7Z16_09210 [Pyrinomonadaceae bacterium]|nr:hypothetical protein [Pyrinomonadaceae bacterium]